MDFEQKVLSICSFFKYADNKTLDRESMVALKKFLLLEDEQTIQTIYDEASTRQFS